MILSMANLAVFVLPFAARILSIGSFYVFPFVILEIMNKSGYSWNESDIGNFFDCGKMIVINDKIHLFDDSTNFL